MASYLVKLEAEALVEPMMREICVAGQTPVASVERVLENYLAGVIRTTLADVILKPPVVRLHSMYFKERYATLPALAKSGYKTWYLEVAFATNPTIAIETIDFETSGIVLHSISYGMGHEVTTQLKAKRMKTQVRYELRINTLSIEGAIFLKVKNAVEAAGTLEQRLIANFSCGPDIESHRVVSFDDMLTGQRYFCDCARDMHTTLRNNADGLRRGYADGSWPHQLSTVLNRPEYLKGICHLCIAKTSSAQEARSRYGASIEEQFLHYVDQVITDQRMDRTTARAEVQQLLGLSRWIREAALYRTIKELFPDHRVVREASPELLGRLRLDIYLPDLKLAIEHQGEQHYRALEVFGGEQAHSEALKRDQLKRDRCTASGIELVEIRYDAAITKIALRHRLSKFIDRRNDPNIKTVTG
jgi:hypothetical protein